MTRGLWDRETVALLLLAALMPVALCWLWFGGGAAAGRLGAVIMIAGAWHGIFMLARAQIPSLAGLASALGVAILAPVDLSPGQLILGVSFGTVMADLVFGGWGRNVLNPATVTLAFLGFGFPAAPWPDFAVPVGWAVLPTLALGIAYGVMPARVVFGAALGLGAALAAGLPVVPVIPAAGLALALLVADPVASAATRLGGWFNGLAYAGFVALFAAGWDGAAPVQIAVSAALLAALAAPLFDEGAITLWLWRRKRHHG